MAEKIRAKKRVPVSGRRNVLSMTGGDTKNFKYRVVNDVGDRVAQFEANGYEIVTDPDIQIGERRVANPTKEGSPIKISVGGGVVGFLMKQKMEHYEEDQKSKAEYIKQTEGAIKRKAAKDADFGKLILDQRD